MYAAVAATNAANLASAISPTPITFELFPQSYAPSGSVNMGSIRRGQSWWLDYKTIGYIPKLKWQECPSESVIHEAFRCHLHQLPIDIVWDMVWPFVAKQVRVELTRHVDVLLPTAVCHTYASGRTEAFVTNPEFLKCDYLLDRIAKPSVWFHDYVKTRMSPSTLELIERKCEAENSAGLAKSLLLIQQARIAATNNKCHEWTRLAPIRRKSDQGLIEHKVIRIRHVLHGTCVPSARTFIITPEITFVRQDFKDGFIVFGGNLL
jgi:hypothetical protein